MEKVNGGKSILSLLNLKSYSGFLLPEVAIAVVMVGLLVSSLISLQSRLFAMSARQNDSINRIIELKSCLANQFFLVKYDQEEKPCKSDVAIAEKSFDKKSQLANRKRIKRLIASKDNQELVLFIFVGEKK